MSTPRRRSSRLRNSSGNTPNNKYNNFASHRLSSLTEGDETLQHGIPSSLDAIVSSPAAPRTPATIGRIKPSHSEMHPGQAHHSTMKLPSEGFALGFMDVQDEKNKAPIEDTPTKTSAVTSPSFDFRFARPAPNLGPEAQRMMDELRDEALRIKAKLAAEREEEKRSNCEDDMLSSRKIAKAKGKAGRFSDVHMEEFKKMDSIAGHASSFRAQPGRFAPATGGLKRSKSKPALVEQGGTQSLAPVQRSLKRTQSKARLDEPESSEPVLRYLKRTQSKAKLGDETATNHSGHVGTEQGQGNSASTKRARVEAPGSSHIQHDQMQPPLTPNKPTTPRLPRSRSILEALTTPTQSSMARAASVKHASNIPTLSRSPSKASLQATPSKMPKPSTVSHLSSMARSFLHRKDKSPGKSISTCSIPVAYTVSRANLDKDLPLPPKTPQPEQSKTSRQPHSSPSPQKSGIPRSKSTRNLGDTISYPKLSTAAQVEPSTSVQYPSLNPRQLPDSSLEALHSPPPPSVPGTFTFRANQTIKFVRSPRGFGASPGQASLRQVRESIIPGSMPGSFPSENKENMTDLPPLAHGISGKKRARADEEMEDIPHFAHGIANKKRNRAEESEGDDDDQDGRSPKKHKAQHLPAQNSSLKIPRLQQKLMAEKAAPQSKIPSPAKKKRVLSFSRLNMLARPKNRK